MDTIATTHYGIQEESTDIVCDPCLSCTLRSERVCVDWCEHLCKVCLVCHAKLSSTQHHGLYKRPGVQQIEDGLSMKDTCTERCHRNTTLEFFCRDHLSLACGVCTCLDHRTCNYMEYLQEGENCLTNNKEFREHERLLQHVNDKSENVSQKIEDKIQSIAISCSEALRKIREFRLKIDKQLDQSENSLLVSLEQYNKHNMKVLNNALYTCREIHGEAETILAENENLRSSGENCTLFVRSFRTKKIVEELERRLRNFDNILNVKEYRFQPNLGFLETIKGLTGIGELKEVMLETVKRAPERLDPCGDFNARSTTDDLPCKITSCAVLPDDMTLILSDYNNQKIKKYNIKERSLRSEIQVSGRPWDLAIIEDANVAVTVPCEKKIMFITVDEELRLERDMQLEMECHGIAKCAEDTLIVTFGDINKLEIMNVKGEVQSAICNQQNQPMVLNKPLYATTNPKMDMIYVSNFSDNSIVCLKLDGSFLWKFTDSQLSGPLSITVDANEMVYVCAKKSHNIHQISKDCKQDKVCIADEDLETRPYSICYNATQDMLYVGILDNDYIKVFRAVR